MSTLSFDSGRGGHTIETLIHALSGTGLVATMEKCAVHQCGHAQNEHANSGYHCQACPERLAYHHFMPGAKTDVGGVVRMQIALLLRSGRLDMRSDGLLMFPEEKPEEFVELFAGSWFAVSTGRHIGGPFKTEGEARRDLDISGR